MNLIVNADKNWGIGNGGSLLFPIKADMKFFRETTTGNVVIMGRATLDSFPNGKALKNRTNIVLTRNESFAREDFTVCHSIDALLEAVKNYESDELFVIGGEQIYRALLPYCDTAYVTRVEAQKAADAYFPDLDNDDNWELTQASEPFDDNGTAYRFCIYKRVKEDSNAR